MVYDAIKFLSVVRENIASRVEAKYSRDWD